jgi:hypothetical protein
MRSKGEAIAMVEYRTQSVEPAVLLEELASFCQVAAGKGKGSAILMFGWDSNLEIDEMWQDIPLPLADIVAYVRAAEQAGTITVGKSDIFVKTNGLEITLCHEGDLHIEAEEAAAQPFLERWESKGFMPYEVLPHTRP